MKTETIRLLSMIIRSAMLSRSGATDLSSAEPPPGANTVRTGAGRPEARQRVLQFPIDQAFGLTESVTRSYDRSHSAQRMTRNWPVMSITTSRAPAGKALIVV